MRHTVVIIGAGPAGLAAADAAIRAGAEVVLVDGGDKPGGQFHRGTADQPADWAVLNHPRCAWLPGKSVWALEQSDSGPPLVHLVGDGRTVISPDALVLACGAHDRVLPFPGWTLPGVFTAGAAQALAKAERVAVGRRVVVSGTGPFLLPVATSLHAVGATVLGVFEANPLATILRGWGINPARFGKLRELGGYAAGFVRHRIPYRTGWAVIEARGDGQLAEVVVARLRPDWSVVPGSERVIEADALCVGHGFTARLELAVAAGCAVRDNAVLVDGDQRTSRDGVFAAGEITGIAGAEAARAEGAVAGCVAAGGRPTAGQRRARDHGRAFGHRLARAHPIGTGWTGWLRPDTVVCRCEAVDLATLNRAFADPVGNGARSVRLGTRAGLGPCQGRMCGPTVAELAVRAGAEAPPAHHRPIAAPIRLGDLATKEKR